MRTVSWLSRFGRLTVAAAINPVVLLILGSPRIASPLKRMLKKVPFLMPVAKRLAYSSFSVPSLIGGGMLPRFTGEHDAGMLSVDTLLARIRAEVAQIGKENG